MDNAEFAVLNGFETDGNPEDFDELVVDFVNGHYEGVVEKVLCEIDADENSIRDKIEGMKDKNRETLFSVFLCGISSLQLFIQNNWTGPATSHLSSFNVNAEYVSKQLSLDGEEIYHLVKYPQLLWLSKVILLDVEEFSEFLSIYWWRLRYLNIHQQVLDERSPTIHNAIKQTVDKIHKLECQMTDRKYCKLKVQLYLEISSICFYFYESKLGKAHLQKAQDVAKLTVNLTGALGKRSRYQQDDVPQLLLNITRNCDAQEIFQTVSEVETQTVYFPKDLELNDEVRLNDIQFKENDVASFPDLYAEDHAIILGLFNQMQKTSAVDKLLDEELLAHLSCILRKPKCWAVQMSALVHRSKLESNHRRTVERSTMQMELLVNEFSVVHAPVVQRLNLFYSSNLPPFWIMQKTFGNLLMKLGSTNSALDIFLRLELWDEIISCYHLLQRRSKAEAIVRQQLAIKETPLLWCYLGDATDDISYYYKADEITNHKFPRALKSLGNYYFQKQNYKEAIPFYEKSLSLNSLQLGLWFNLGYAAMHEEIWQTAAKAYQRYCCLEPESCEVWNNLANVYIKQGQMNRAWLMLQEALKHNFEDWRIWENYLLVSVDIGAFDEALRAYNRIVDLKEKHADTAVLKILVNAVIQGTLDNCEKSATSLKPKLKQLFEKITTKTRDSVEVFKLYSDLLSSDVDLSVEDQYKVIQTLNKAFVLAVQQFKWNEAEDDLKLSINLLEKCIQLVSSDSRGRSSSYFPLMMSIKLAINSFNTLMTQYIADHAINSETPENVASLFKSFQEQQSRYICALNIGKYV